MDGVQEPRFPEDDFVKRGWFSSIFQFLQRRTKVVTVTAAYDIPSDVWIVRADATAAAFAVTLPLSGDWGGRELRVIKIDSVAHNVTVTRRGSDLIGGASTKVLSSQYDNVTTVADGTTNWDIF